MLTLVVSPAALHCRCVCSRKFSKPPIGPIGAHLTLTDIKWATAGEVVLGGSLELWIVHNAKDNTVRHAVLSCSSAYFKQA